MNYKCLQMRSTHARSGSRLPDTHDGGARHTAGVLDTQYECVSNKLALSDTPKQQVASGRTPPC